MNKKLQLLEDVFADVAKKYAVIGVIGGSHTDEEGRTFGMAELAAEHEFGDDKTGVPERSFLRSSLNENKEDYKEKLAALFRQAARGQAPANNIYSTIGAVAAGNAQQKIQSGELKPLKAATIRRKGSSKPLIDTGQLVQSITWDVRQ